MSKFLNRKIYCVFCDKYKKFKNTKTSNILKETLVNSITCSKCGSKYENTFKKEEPIEVFKIFDLANNTLLKDMAEENINQKFRMK